MPGYRGVSFSISARATSKRLGTPTITSTTSTVNSAGQRLVNGTVKNPYSGTTTSFGVAVTLYDGRATVLDVKRSVLGASSLGPGKSTTFRTTFGAVGLNPGRTYVRGVLHR